MVTSLASQSGVLVGRQDIQALILAYSIRTLIVFILLSSGGSIKSKTGVQQGHNGAFRTPLNPPLYRTQVFSENSSCSPTS